MRHGYSLLGTALFLSFIVIVFPETGSPAGEPEAIPEKMMISPREAHELYRTGKAVFVDARKEADYRREHIPDAVNIEPGALDARPERICEIKGLPIVIYCYRGGGTAGRLAKEMRSRGITRFRLLEGHWAAWKAAGYPTTSEDKAGNSPPFPISRKPPPSP